MDQELKNSILKTGTTILGIVCKDGVVMAADRQTTAGNSIAYHKNSEKVRALNGYLVFAGCGSAAEVQKVGQILAAELRLKELKSKARPTIKQAASLLSNIQALESAFILGGFDESGGAALYDILGGHLSEIDDYTASAGSGMPYALGLMERQYKKGMSIQEGIELAKEAIKSSTQRDVFSGYGIDVFIITKEGIQKVVEQEIKPEYVDDKAA
jgi:proteasome beta subunit